MGVLFDADILINILRGATKSSLDPDEELFLSALTVFEVESGIARMSTAARRTWCDLLAVTAILPLTKEEALLAARVAARLDDAGLKVASPDLLIAATAMTHDCALMTNNKRHFGRIEGLKMR